MKTLTMCALLGVLLPPAASAAEAWQAPAAAVCADQAEPRRQGDFEQLLTDQAPPEALLPQACSRWRREATPDAALDVLMGQITRDSGKTDEALLQALRHTLEADSQHQPWDGARLLHARAALADEKSDPASAVTLYGQALAMLEQAGLTARPRFWLLRLAQGFVLCRLRGPGDLQRAGAAADATEQALRAAGQAQGLLMSVVFNLRTVIAHAQDDLAAALRWSRADLALILQLGRGEEASTIDTYINIGSIASQLDLVDEAEAAFVAGLRLVERLPNASAYSRQGVYNNYASLLFARGRHAEALALARQGLAIARAGHAAGSGKLVSPLLRVAEAEYILVRYGTALALLEEARRIVDASGTGVPMTSRLRLRKDLMEVYTSLADSDSARREGEAGLALTATEAPGYWRGRFLVGLAVLDLDAGQAAQAETRFAEGEPLIARTIGAEHRFVTGVIARRCVAQLRAGLPGEACARLQARLAALAAATSYDRFVAQAALHEAALESRDADGALQHSLLALAAAQSTGTADPLWTAWDALARQLRQRGARAQAVLAGKQAVAQIELLRGDVRAQSRLLERGFLTDKRAVYERLAGWLAEDGRVAEAVQVLTLLKEQEFHDYLRGGLALKQALGDEALLSAEEVKLLAGWSAQGLTAEEEVPQRETPAERQARQARAEARSAEEGRRAAVWLQALAREFASPAPAGRPLPTVTLAPARPGWLRAWLFSSEGRLHLLLADARGRTSRLQRDLPEAELAARIGALLAATSAREPVQAALGALYPLVGAPLAEAARKAGARGLALQLNGALRYLPLAAVLAQGGAAALAVEQQLPAAPVPAPRRAALPTRLRALGVTQALGGQTALPAMAGELCAIVKGRIQGLADEDRPCERAGLLDGEGWVNAHFTRARLEAASSGPAGTRNLLHLGTHFLLRPGRMESSWMLLGDGERLGLADLGRLSFEQQDLVTLSGCETGMGGTGSTGADGRELDGLNLLLLRRGAGAVLASLWRVEDASTAALMRAFYAGLAQGREPAEALARAQALVRRDARWAHPFYWSGFYLVARAR